MKTTMFNTLLKNTEYTDEEWAIYQKVDKHNKLEDLADTLYDMLLDDTITKEQYCIALDNADYIIILYEKNDNPDWQLTMKEAIRSILNNEKTTV